MKLIVALCLFDWICFSNAGTSYADRGLVVSRLPWFWFTGGIDIYHGDIEKFNSNTRISPKKYDLTNDEDIRSLKSDPHNSRLIYYDLYHKRLVALENFNTWLNDTNMTTRVIHEGISGTGHGRIAYDWLTRNLYWSDNKYNWIAVQNIDHIDTSSYRILIHEGVKVPAGIAIDPIKRMFFWAEHGYTSTVIIRSDLLGGNRKIIRSGVKSVADMVTDSEFTMLYWVDNVRRTVEKCNYDGENWGVLYAKASYVYMTAITLYKTLVCVLEYYRDGIICIDKISESVTWSKGDQYAIEWGMDMYYIENQPQASHPCQDYGCSDMCINTDNGAVCVCREGYEKDSRDPKNCVPSHILHGKSLLFTNGVDVCMFDVRVLTGYINNASCFTQWNGTITHMTVDTSNTLLFFSDESKSGIYRYDLKTQTSTDLVTTGVVSGLRYDWIENNLYWSESDTGTIRVAKADQTDVTNTIVSNLINPRNLEVYPHGDMMFWIAEKGNAPLIQSYSAKTGITTTVLDHASLSNPISLCYNENHEKLYFVDKGYLSRMDKDGSNIEQRYEVHSVDLLLCYQDYAAVYTVYTGGDVIKSENVHDGALATTFAIDILQYDTVRAMTIYDPNSQRKEKNACETNNGGCQHICIATSDTQRECKCSFGYELKNDKANCTTRPKTSNLALTVDFNHQEIFQIDINNGSNINAISLPRPARPIAATYFDQHIYWSDYETDKILRSNLTGGNTTSIYTMEQYLCFNLAVDSSTGNVFYIGEPYTSDKTYSYIAVLHPGTSKHKTLYDKIINAGGLALYPSKGLMFWVDQGISEDWALIQKANMDGSNIRPFLPRGFVPAFSLAIGYSENKLYWTNSKEDSIEYAALDGTERGLFYKDVNAEIHHLAVGPSNVFYTATNKQRVTKISKDDKKTRIWMNKQPEMGRLQYLDVFVDGYSTPVHPSCNKNNGMCSTFCLPISDTYRRCACEDGKELQEDKHTCEGVLKCPMAIPNGTFSDTCMPYKDKRCDFSCNKGYSKTTESQLTCSVHASLPNALQWDIDLAGLCAITVIPTTVFPTQGAMQGLGPGVVSEVSSGVTPGTFAGVVVAIVIIFLVIILGLIFVISKKRRMETYAHGNFIHSKNVPSMSNITVSRDSDLDRLDEKVAHEQRTSKGPAARASQGLENPVYKEINQPKTERQNQNPYVTKIDISKL